MTHDGRGDVTLTFWARATTAPARLETRLETTRRRGAAT